MNYILLIYPEQFPSCSKMMIWNKCSELFENVEARCVHELLNSYIQPSPTLRKSKHLGKENWKYLYIRGASHKSKGVTS